MRNSEPLSRLRPARAVLVIASRRRARLGAQAADCAPYLFAFPFRGKAPQWAFVFTLMTLELGLVPLPLYARNR